MAAISVIRTAQPMALHPLTVASGIAVALAAVSLTELSRAANDDNWPIGPASGSRSPVQLKFVGFLRPGRNS